MMSKKVDLMIVGAGPVGLMCAYLAELCGMSTMVIDKSEAPLEVGRADALNARTLQLLEVVDLFQELYPLGKPCHTSSVWSGGEFVSRESAWWDEIEGCKHKHFLMLGQAFVEKLLDKKLKNIDAAVKRSTSIEDVELLENGCQTYLSNGDRVESRYIIGADGSRSFIRNKFEIPFNIKRPELVWAVIDGVVETSFPKVPEIIVFQAETSDVAWIPREGKIDRFYVRMDKKNFEQKEVMAKIHKAIAPHTLSFKDIEWFSQFSVKESVADNFLKHERIFLAGDACHIHSVNGGQGLNTGLGDAFNLIWKLNMVTNFGAPKSLLQNYENERKPVALSVIESSGELVRSTKFSKTGTHAKDYVQIVKKRSGNITGMGISYSGEGLIGKRLFDFNINTGAKKTRLYSMLDYTKFTLLIFGETEISESLPDYIKVIQINEGENDMDFKKYKNKAVLVRPDAYIHSTSEISELDKLIRDIW